ncbi:MAG: hypothetical protein U1F18_01305 [Steroidobacteraceae bacterium]|jgi:hypothetical protein
MAAAFDATIFSGFVTSRDEISAKRQWLGRLFREAALALRESAGD